MTEQILDDKSILVLRKILQQLRWDDQEGYPGYRGDGKWDFAATSITVEPDELNALFALAGIDPDPIVPNGNCENCVFSINGSERGYRAPCCRCSRPKHSHFVKRTSTRLKVLQQHPQDHRLYDLCEAFMAGA